MRRRLSCEERVPAPDFPERIQRAVMKMAPSIKKQVKILATILGLAVAVGALALLPGSASRAAAPTAVQPNAAPAVEATATPIPAAWLVVSSFAASSLETGGIGYLEAWSTTGGAYTYRYALSGQPAGVTVDSETGLLSISASLPVKTYAFQAVVTNRQAASVVARFPVTLNVVTGVTSNRKPGQILHKAYYVDSGTYGRPQGTNYTAVLLNIQKAVLADQGTVGDGKLRATIYFRRGLLYDYTTNDWPAGMQFVTIATDPKVNTSGPRPRLRNIRKTYIFDSELAIIGTGTGSAFDLDPDKIKTYSPAIATAQAGQNTVTLKVAGDAAKLTPGRWYLVGSYDQQVEGFPPNIRSYDYVRMVSVSGGVVKLDRKLQHRHPNDGFEVPSSPNSMGVARIIPLDLGGTQGFSPSKRLTIRQTFKDIEFLKNSSTTNGSNTVMYIGTGIDIAFYNCILPRPVPSIVQHALFSGGTIATSEPDKLITTLIFDHVASGEIGGATGVEFMLMRGAVTAPIQVSPRHLRLINMTIDATNNTHLWYPVTFAYNGPVLSAEFEATTFKINPTNSDRRIMPRIQRASTTIGGDSHWSGSTLVIPRKSANFLDWEVWAYEGATIVNSTGSVKGVIQHLSGAADGSAILVSIGWTVGQKPASGTISFTRGRFLSFDAQSKLYGRSLWTSTCGGFEQQQLPPSFTAAAVSTQ